MAQHRATTVVPLSGLRLGVAALLVSMATGALLGACNDGTRTPSPSPLPTVQTVPKDEFHVPSLGGE